LHLDIDGACLDALKRDRGHALNHAGAASPGELSQDRVQVQDHLENTVQIGQPS
jgi:hypothetical protein